MIALQVLGTVLLPAVVVASIPRPWLWRAVLLWFGVPLAAWAAILMLGVPNTPHGADAFGRNLYNLAFLFPMLAIPFLLLTGLVLGLGLLLRRLLRPAGVPASASAPRLVSPRPWARAAATSRADPAARLLAPDGRIAVDLAPVEWFNGHWIQGPRVTDLATGRVLLDLHGRDWDATVEFPSAGRLVLGLHGQASGAVLALEMNLDAGTCRIRTGPTVQEAWPPVPLEQAAAQVSAAAAAAEAHRARRPSPSGASRFAAWRTALVILVLALLAIGVLTWLSVTFGWKPPPTPRAFLRSLLP